MTTFSAHSDVWVIHQEQALLYRQQAQMWTLESSMPFADFHGSAVALASFTLADTCVYLNVQHGEKLTDSLQEFRWTGIEQDPLRLTQFPQTAQQVQQLRKLKNMGKQAHAIATSEPAQFANASRLFLTSQQETEHLKRWIKSRNNGTSRRLANAQLFYSLWVKPCHQHQIIRGVAVVCTALAIATMQWTQNQQIKQYETQWQKSIQETHEYRADLTTKIPFKEWITQIKKFGQNNRANLSALTIHWSDSESVYTVAQLDRDRKRVPKGCKLVNSKRAECVSQRAER